MRRSLTVAAASVLALSLTIPVFAFFSQIDSLKQDMTAWQASHATDFGDLLATLTNIEGPTFTDVTSDAWFGPYVTTVSGWGVVSGYADASGKSTGMYGPANNVTVAEMLKMAFKLYKVDTTTCGTATPTHASAVGHWAQSFVACGEEMKLRILQDASLNINRAITRAEVLGILDDVSGANVPPLYSNFKDTHGHALESDIAFAYMNKIITGDKNKNGVETGTFRPDSSINRAEVAKILYESAKVKVQGNT